MKVVTASGLSKSVRATQWERGVLGAMLNEHSLRREIVGEMHLRRWPPITPPMTVVQILRLVPAGTTVDGLPPFRTGDAPFSAAGQRHMDGTLGEGVSPLRGNATAKQRRSPCSPMPDAPLLARCPRLGRKRAGPSAARHADRYRSRCRRRRAPDGSLRSRSGRACLLRFRRGSAAPLRFPHQG